MRETLLRAEALLGAEAMARLRVTRILVVGLGAVGGACVEALALPLPRVCATSPQPVP